MKFLYKHKLFLVLLIALINLFFASFKLNDVPNGIYVDEATSGVNAYSILKTGKDEYGKEFPVAFRFFGSYSPPLYVYLTVIPVYLFGLNEYSVRIISVIAGTLMVIVIYQFLKSIESIPEKIIPFLLFLFIVTPWNFFYERTGYELYLGFLMLSAGALLFHLSIKKNNLFLPGSLIMSVATYCAHPELFSVPIFIAGFILLFNSKIKKEYFIKGALIFLFIQIPHILLLNTKVFLNKSDLFYSDEILRAAGLFNIPQIISFPISFLYSLSARISAFMSPRLLFFLGDPDPQRSMPDLSVFYNWMILPYLVGLYFLLKEFKSEISRFLILLIFACALPASLARDPFSTQRGLALLLPLFLIICIGISKIYLKINFKIFIGASIFLFVFSLITLWRSYFVLLPAERSASWNYGYKELSDFIIKNPQEKFVIDQNRGKPAYIELAFFLKTDPEVLQNSTDPKIRQNYYNFSDFNPEYSFNNIETRGIKWESDIYKSQILAGDEVSISPPQVKEHYLEEVFSISDPRGYPVLKAYKTNPAKKCQETNFASQNCVRY